MAASQEEPTLTRPEEENDDDVSKEEDTGAHVAPIIKLEEVAVTTGEEEEDALLDMKAKLYRFDKDGNQWKERGVGTVKILKHKESAKVRLVMRQSKTLKICANHSILASMSLQEHAGSDKSWVWHASDFSDGELKDELFCIRLGSVENAKKFKETFEKIVESQTNSSEDGAEAPESAAEAAESAADLIQNLTVEDQKEEAKEEIKVEEKKEDKLEEKEKPAESEK